MKQLIVIIVLCSTFQYNFNNPDILLQKFSVSRCIGGDECVFSPKLEKVEISSDSIIIAIKANENCILGERDEVLGYINVNGDSLKLGVSQRATYINHKGYEVEREALPYAACHCTFIYEYVLKVSDIQTDFDIYYEGESHHSQRWANRKLNWRSPEYGIIKGDTINEIDKYGFRQGLFKLNEMNLNRSGSEDDYVIFLDDMAIEVKLFDSLGNVKEHHKSSFRPCI